MTDIKEIEELLEQLEEDARANGVESMGRNAFWDDNDTTSQIDVILSIFKEQEEKLETEIAKSRAFEKVSDRLKSELKTKDDTISNLESDIIIRNSNINEMEIKLKARDEKIGIFEFFIDEHEMREAFNDWNNS